jgi:tryptophan-associated transmembrane protein
MTAGPQDAKPAPGLSVRGQLVLAVVATTVGAVLLLWAMTRSWVVEVTPRQAPMHALRSVHTGTDLVPWVPALALIALAGAGALVATRAAGRVLVSALLVVVGAGSALGSAYGVLAGRRLTASASVTWPLIGAVGGVVVAAAGWYALRRCRSWPTMGSRYETPTARAAAAEAGSDPAATEATGSGRTETGATGSGSDGDRPERPEVPQRLTGRRRAAVEDDPAKLWDALDEGHDPTDR